MEFSYSYVKTETAQLEIEDIGNVSIRAVSGQGFLYYLLIKTYDGFSQVLQFGPYQPDFDSQPSNVTVVETWQRIAFSQKKLVRVIDDFLNDPRKGILQAEVIDRDEAYSGISSMSDYMRTHDY